MKIYIAGKISGDLEYKAKFRVAEQKLRDMGHSVMNPAWICSSPEFDWNDYMKVSGAMLDVCSGVLFLKDWLSSRGAREEMSRAAESGKHIFMDLSEVPGGEEDS
ncbi:MAG: DUF4406 domain-containing protein [Treponema sp.]|nr:DUF4406 domain-containing protein [Treponema sp.]